MFVNFYKLYISFLIYIIYSNFFCKICRGGGVVKRASLESWSLALHEFESRPLRILFILNVIKKMVKENITYNDFVKLDIRIGTIVEAEIVEGSDKLLKLIIDFNDFKRQIIAGIKTKYQPSEVINKQIPVIVNLEPRKLMGLESQGMILAIGSKDLDALLLPSESVLDGSQVH